LCQNYIAFLQRKKKKTKTNKGKMLACE
jgi:hypothetical protein